VALEDMKRRGATYLGLRPPAPPPLPAKRRVFGYYYFVQTFVAVFVFRAVQRILWWPWALLAVVGASAIAGSVYVAYLKRPPRS
jgi:uncharacterized membrane protein